MKVLLSVPAFFPHSFGGGEVYVDRVARELLRRGHAPTVLTSSPAGARRTTIERYDFRSVPVVSFTPALLDPREAHTGLGSELRATIAHVIADERPDLVHVNGWKPAVAATCRELGIPHVVTAHHAGIACPNGTLVRPDGSHCELPMSPGSCVPCANRVRRPRWHAGLLLGAIPPWLYRPLGRNLNRAPRLGYAGRGLIFPWLVEQALAAKRTVLDDAAPIVAPSAYVRDLLIRNGRARDTIFVVPHGIEPLDRAAFEPLQDRPVRFGYVGRIERLKGLHVLLDALSLLRAPARWELHVFGAARNAWDAKYLEDALARAVDPDRVRLHGRVDHGDLSSAFATFDVLVVPSLLPEAFGLVVLESFSAGRPVIVFRSGALGELVRDGVDGLVVRGNDAASLARALQACLDEPGAVTGMAGAVPAVRNMQQHVEDLLLVYQHALSARAP